MSTVREILKVKGSHVETIEDSASVLNAVRTMNRLRIACLVVIGENDAISGIISERDVLRLIEELRGDLSSIPVSAVMSRKVIVCRDTDCIDTIRAVMKKSWYRQLPVVDEADKLVGLVTVGDVNDYLVDEEEVEIKYLRAYISRKS